MPLDLNSTYDDIADRLQSYKTVSDIYQNEKLRKKISSAGNNLDNAKSDVTQNLNDIKDKSQRLHGDVKNQYDQMIDLFKMSVSNPPSTGSNSLDFLIRQVLGAAQNTKSRISEIVVNEIIKTAGCSEEQTFDGNQTGGSRNNKIYVRINQIDLFKILKHDPQEKFNSLLYEKENRVNGSFPYPMDKELYTRIQNEGTSFYDEFNQDYMGESGGQIMDIKYVTSYQDGGVTYNGDFLEVTLTNRITGNNLSDFLKRLL